VSADGEVVFNAHLRPAQPHVLPATLAFHRSLPAYAVTPCVELAELARELAVSSVVVKNEQSRLGLPSFKLLGSSWAVHERIRRRIGRPAGEVLTLARLREEVRTAHATLCTASDGNYGRSIAALSQLLWCESVIFLPADTVAARVADVRMHGARVELVDGSYDDTVAAARSESAKAGYWYCPDTAGFDADAAELAFVADVTAGYVTLFRELVDQLGHGPDVLFIQAGVGGLAAGAAVALEALAPATRIVTVEPAGSNCVQVSIAAGEPRTVRDQFTMLAGLRCQSVSAAAWPLLRARISAALTVSEADAASAMRLLAARGIVAGESGAAGLAGAAVALRSADMCARLNIDRTSVVAVVNTEGATDPVNYARIVPP
jgi:diaminopropionate ammonia-lyase